MLPDISGALRLAFDVAKAAFAAAHWGAVTTALGLVACWRTLVFVTRIPAIFATTRRCPRGHRVPQYGVFECRSCRSNHEGWVFGRCKVCGDSAGWTPCPICGLPVRNPIR